MYAEFFALRQAPFNNTPDPRFFFPTSDHEEALASLIYAVEELKGYVLLTGEVGSGKTLITRVMLRQFKDRIASGVITNTAMSSNELLLSICSEFGVDADHDAPRLDHLHAFQEFLLRQFAANVPVVLIIDEAQNLSDAAFEQLRMIGNLEADDTKLLQMIIVGQPELRERFNAYHLRQLKQRMFRSFHLPNLSRTDCVRYINHRLTVAGFDHGADSSKETAWSRYFDSEAIDVIYQYSGGLPRLINSLCDNSMVNAYAEGRSFIDGRLMAEVAIELIGYDEPSSQYVPVAKLEESEASELEVVTADEKPVVTTDASPADVAPTVEDEQVPEVSDIGTVDELPPLTPLSETRVASEAAWCFEDCRLADMRQNADASYERLIHHLADIQVPFERSSSSQLSGTDRLGAPRQLTEPQVSNKPADQLVQMLEDSRSSLDTLRQLVSRRPPGRVCKSHLATEWASAGTHATS